MRTPLMIRTTSIGEQADILARKFKVDTEALPGHRFSYRVVPAEHGKFMVDFELVGGPETQVVA
jgi:hypothetical protein